MDFIVTDPSVKPKGVVHFYNGRGTAEQWIKEGKYALNWTWFSCHRFVANQAGLAQGSQRLVIAQPSGEVDQDGGLDCASCSARRFPAS